ELKKEGQAGQNKLTQYTRYLTIGLAILQATGVIALATRGGMFGNCPDPVIPDDSVASTAMIVLTMTAGTAVMMWMGELITERGGGNRVAAVFAVWCVSVLAIISSVIFAGRGQRRIPVQYAKRMGGRGMYGGPSPSLPIKVNRAGVIPVIFASSLLYLPDLIS